MTARGRRALRLLAACAMACGALAVPPASAAGVAPNPCTELAVSPTFAADGTAVCAGVVYEPTTGSATSVAVFVTTDKGHSWRKATAAGVAITRPDDYLRGVLVSPRYSADHMIVVQLARAGVLASTDLGTTFTLVSPLGLGRVTPFVATPDAVAARPLLVHADAAGNDVSMQVDPVSHAVAPVPGTPAKDREFAVSPHYATDGLAFAGAMVASSDGTYASPAVYACTAGFACTEQRFLGPPRSVLDRLWTMPSSAPPGFVVVLRVLVGSTPRLWRSLDGGRTFRPWTSVNAVGATMGAGPSQLAVTADPAKPDRLYLRASWLSVDGTPPDEQLFVSTDGGTRWSRVAYGSTVRLRHTGSMPATSPGDYRATAAGFVVAAGAGRLFLLTGGPRDPDYSGPYCSRDAGRTWARTC